VVDVPRTLEPDIAHELVGESGSEPPQQEAEVLRHFRELFERNNTGYEVEAEIIRDVFAQLPDFIQGFGGVPISNLGPEHIHIIDESKLSQEQQKLIQNGRGWYLATYQAAFVGPDASRLRTAEAIIHELSISAAWRLLNNSAFRSKDS
jgi:hypothetical protein